MAPLECTLHYFYRIMKKSNHFPRRFLNFSVPAGNIVITRQALQKMPDWVSSTKPITNVKAVKGKSFS